MYRIERADISDESVRKIRRKLHSDCFTVDEVLEPDTGYWWIVWWKSYPVGFCAMRESYNWQKTFYLWRAGVISIHRRKGLQRRMIRVREALARKLGGEYMISDTNLNPSSANNLIKCGYLTYNPMNPYGFETAIYWRKKL